MQGKRHDAVGGVECLLDAVAMVAVNIDIEYALIMSAKALTWAEPVQSPVNLVPEHFENSKNNICLSISNATEAKKESTNHSRNRTH